MKKLLDVAHGKLINIIGRHGVWINIHGCQSYPRMTICVVNQLKNEAIVRDKEPTLSNISISFKNLFEKMFMNFAILILVKHPIQLSHMPPPNTRGAYFESLVSDQLFSVISVA